MEYHTITWTNQCPIRPEHINASTGRNFMGSVWRNMETEIAASWLVRFAQYRGSWMPFTLEDLESFYHKEFPRKKFYFNKLSETYIQSLNEDDYWNRDWLAFTAEFIAACYLASPVLLED